MVFSRFQGLLFVHVLLVTFVYSTPFLIFFTTFWSQCTMYDTSPKVMKILQFLIKVNITCFCIVFEIKNTIQKQKIDCKKVS